MCLGRKLKLRVQVSLEEQHPREGMELLGRKTGRGSALKRAAGFAGGDA